MGHVVSLFLRFYRMIVTYTYTDAWGRTVESMLIEWEMHNYFYFATFHERVAHTDFDKDSEGWKRIDYLTYAIWEVWNDYVKH